MAKDYAVLPKQKVIEAIEAGNKEEALKALEEFAGLEEWAKDFFVAIVNSMVTYIAKENGEEAAYLAWRHVSEDLWKPVHDMMKTASHADIVQIFKNLHSSLFSKYTVEEFDDRTVVSVSECGSGGKLMKLGYYDNTDRTPIMGGTTKEKHGWGCNKVGFPYYCVHATCWYDIFPKEWGFPILGYEHGRQYDNDGNLVDEPCKIIIYKEPQK